MTKRKFQLGHTPQQILLIAHSCPASIVNLLEETLYHVLFHAQVVHTNGHFEFFYTDERVCGATLLHELAGHKADEQCQ